MRVLVAMDGSEVAETALAAVAPWAKAGKGDVHLLTVLHPETVHESGEATMIATGPGSGGPGAVAKPQRRTIEDRTQALARARHEAQDYLSLMAAHYLPAIPHSINVSWAEDTADEICRLAETLKVDLIAVGTHGRQGMSRALLGSVADDVVRRASAPVLIVRWGTVELIQKTQGAVPKPARRSPGKERLLTYLSQNAAPFMLVHHSPAFTAHEMASVERLRDHMVAKVVLAFADGNLVMFVIPGDLHLDRGKARQVLGVRDIRLATEDEMATHIPDCEVGAVHPFGNLYGLAVYSDQKLVEQRSLAFFAGVHSDTVYMESSDFIRLAQPTLCEIAATRKANGHNEKEEA